MQARLVLLIALAAVLALSGLAGAPARVEAGRGDAADAIIVRFVDDPGSGGVVSAVAERLGEAGLRLTAEPLGLPGLYRVGLPAGHDGQRVAARLAVTDGVRYAEVDGPIRAEAPLARLAALESDAVDAWGLHRIGAEDAWSFGDGHGVVVAVLDTGVSATHPALAGRVLPGWNFVADNDDTSDTVGHGTYVAAIIAGRAEPGSPDDFSGVAPGALILPVTILGPDATGSTAAFAAGIVYAVDQGAQVINISASGVSPSPSLLDALAYAEEHEVVVVTTAGNRPGGQVTYPAAVPSVVAVAASDREDQIASFSAYGPWVRLAAPGVDIVSAWSGAMGDAGYRVASGTSAAAPFVAGAAALVRGLDPGLPAFAVRQALTAAALDLGDPGLDAHSGAGRLDVALTTRLVAPVAEAGLAIADAQGEGADARLTLLAEGLTPGEPLQTWITAADGTDYVVRGLVSDGEGALNAELATIAELPIGPALVTVVGEESGRVLQATYDVTALPRHPAFEPVGPFEDIAERRYFPETGHTLAHGFLTFWEANGGLAVFGYPISEEFLERNPDTGEIHTVQYFERNRLEYHPEHAGTPQEVMIGRLGAQLPARPFPAGPVLPDTPDRRYFPETGHSLSGPFLEFWNTRGGLPLFGYPLSEPFEEGDSLVQYFERARFELRPHLPAEHRVLLAHLGIDLARRAGYLG